MRTIIINRLLLSFIVFTIIVLSIISCSYINATFPPFSVSFPAIANTDALADSIKIVRHTFKKKETFMDALHSTGLPASQLFNVIDSTKPLQSSLHSFRKIKPGDTVTVVYNKAAKEMLSLTYEIDFKTTLLVKRNSDGFEPIILEFPVEKKNKRVSCYITNSLYEDGLSAGLSAQKVMELTDIFPWDIDFFTDLHQGDSFRVLYEEQERDGKVVAEGKILAAEIIKDGKAHRAFYFETAKKKGSYYDQLGKSLKKQFLKSPLRFRRISSGFSRRRFHPILKQYRPHFGIDYVAPAGTPIEAVADGKVLFKGRKGGYGNYIKIQHANNYVSCYGHLSRFAKRIKKGHRVKQGEVIGYVGSTGLATGPHLDFRLSKSGRYINPLSIKNVIVESIAIRQQPEFKKMVNTRLTQLAGSDTEMIGKREEQETRKN